MPSYKVIAPGFDGKLYSPTGKRNVLHRDKPFPMEDKKEQVPSWLERVKEESAAQKKKREAAEKKAAEAAAQKTEDDQKEIADASFMGDGEQSGSNVETL